MTTINRLSSVDALQPGDLIPVWDTSNGGPRKASMNTLLAFIESNFADPEYTTRIVSPAASGWNIDIGDTGTSSWLVINPVADYALGSISLPSSAFAVNGQEIVVVCTGAVTAFSVTSSGATVSGTPIVLAAYSSFRIRYNTEQLTWYTLDNDLSPAFASLVSYTPAGAGAVVDTVQNKLRESVSVKDFGAVGDGVTDDTAAIQAAINSNVSIIDMPAGVYLVSATLTSAFPTHLRGEGPLSTQIKFTANASLVNQSVLFLFSEMQFNVFDQGNAFTSTLVRLIAPTATALQGQSLLDNVSFWANSTSASSVAYALETEGTGYIAYNKIDGMITRGLWGASIEIDCAVGGFIQGNTFTGLNLASQSWVTYPGAETEIHGNQFSGQFQSSGAGNHVIEGSYFGPIWDQASNGAFIDPKPRSLIASDSSDGQLYLAQGSPTKGAVGWSALTGYAFIQNEYLRDYFGSSQVTNYENDTYHKGDRGMSEFVDFCQGKQFDPKMTLTNMPGVGASGHGNGGVVMPAISTSESVTSAWMGLTNTGCTLSKFPTFVTHVKCGNRSGNSAAAFQNTEHRIGLLDSSAGTNGVYVRREWVSGTSWNNYLDVAAGGVVIYSLLLVRAAGGTGAGATITSSLDQTDRFQFWVDETNIYFEMTFETFNQAIGVTSCKRVGLNQWSGVITIPLSTASMFSTTAIELNPLYIATPATFDADQLRLRWKRLEFRHTQY